MSTTTLISGANKRPSLVFVLSSIAIVFLLFFIDEGNYSFNGFNQPVHWLVFFIYSIPIFLGQLLTYKLISKTVKGTEGVLLSIIIGSVLALILVISTFYLIK